MGKKCNFKLETMTIIILANILLLISGVVFYTTFKQPIMTVVIPELDALQAWKAIGMVLSAVAIVIAIIQHLTKEITWLRIFLIFLSTIEIILEILLTVLIFRNTNFVANYVVLIVISSFSVILLIVAAILLVRQLQIGRASCRERV